jgi:hypothetical protein
MHIATALYVHAVVCAVFVHVGTAVYTLQYITCVQQCFKVCRSGIAFVLSTARNRLVVLLPQPYLQ